MAKGEQRYASVKPSTAEEGASFGFPTGSIVTITEARWTTWGEAGEKALKGGRKADDPCLAITGEIEDFDGDAITDHLGAGKAARYEPTKDGEHLVGPNISKSCNAYVFLESVSNKKQQGKLTFDEELLDEPGVSSLVGLKFRAGKIIIKRENLPDTDEDGVKRTPRPTLISEENIELPSGKKSGSGGGKKSAKSASKRAAKDEDEDDDEDTDKDSDTDTDSDPEEIAEKAILAALDSPKYRKGISVEDQLFAAVHNTLKTMDVDKKTRAQIDAFVQDEDWLGHKKRPWSVSDEGVLTSE